MDELSIRYIWPSDLKPNTYNPNVMDEVTYLKAIESIHRFGFIDPVTAREAEAAPWVIIDGEHRWKAARSHSAECRPKDDLHVGMTVMPVIFLDVDDADAEQLTIVLNELRGKPNPEKLAALVRDLSTRRPVAELEAVLPFRRQQLAAMIAERREQIDWDSLGQKPEAAKKERWVERVYRMPSAAAEVVDDAIKKVKSDVEIEDDWRALELICADYMAG